MNRLLGAVTCLVLAGFFQIWANTQHTLTEKDITRYTKRKGQLVQERQRLEVERTRLRAPARIREIASRRLDFQTPDPEQIVEMP